MASATTTNQDPLLKRLYPQGVAFPAYEKSKFLALMKKDTSFGGLGRQVNVTISPGSGGSASFVEALASQGATSEKNFFLVHRKEYQIGTIQNDLIARSMGDKNAIVEAIRQQLDKKRYAFNRALCARAWGNGGGAIGTINSATTGTQITLLVRADIANFFVGMQVQVSSDDGSASSPAGTRDSGKKLTINAVDTAGGKLTANANWNTIAGCVSGDKVFRAGDYSIAMSGVRGWNPIAAPTTGDSFMSLDRFAAGDIRALSGMRVTSQGMRKETLIRASAEAHFHGAQPSTVFLSPFDWEGLMKEMEEKHFIDVKTKVPGISFRGIEVEGPSNTMVLVAETDVPQGYFWATNPQEEWTLRTAGECPRFVTRDKSFLDASDDDAIQFRLGAYGNIENSNPGNTVIGTW